MIGQTLDGRYEILRRIGGGGMGTVYEALHRGTGRRVAVKVLSGTFSRNQTAQARFQREARAGGSIASRYITEVLDTGIDPASEQPFIVMELLEGEDLGQVLDRVRVLAPDVALRVTAQAALGLAKAHEAGVIHRDIKPGNLLLARGEGGEITVKLCDFGVAKIVIDRIQEIEKSGLTRTGHVLGSPLYMSPEQARGNKDIDARSDLWSLGIVLYQMLSGRRPHDDIDALGELIIAICSEPPQPVQELAPWVPAEVAAVVHRALRFDPAERFGGAGEMLEAIRPLLPGGWALEEAMLGPLPEEARRQVAPRFVPEAAAGGAGATAQEAEARSSGVELAPTMADAPLAAAMMPLKGSVAPPPPQEGRAIAPSIPEPTVPGRAGPGKAGSSQTGARVGVALAAVLVVAGAVVAVSRGSGSDEPGPGAGSPRTAAPADTAPAEPAPGPGTAPTAPSTAAGAAQPARTVRLVLIPAEVSVELDGAPASPRGGVLEIRGALGSKHEVRIRKGAREARAEVEITESGASPPKLELNPAD